MNERDSAEAHPILAYGVLVPPAASVPKSSPTFNILDARGAITLAERQAFFRRMRELARRVAEGYEEQRKELEYPLLKESQTSKVKSQVSEGRSTFDLRPATFILEIGVEELPANDVDTAHGLLSARILTLLDELHLEHADDRVFTTP